MMIDFDTKDLEFLFKTAQDENPKEDKVESLQDSLDYNEILRRKRKLLNNTHGWGETLPQEVDRLLVNAKDTYQAITVEIDRMLDTTTEVSHENLRTLALLSIAEAQLIRTQLELEKSKASFYWENNSESKKSE